MCIIFRFTSLLLVATLVACGGSSSGSNGRFTLNTDFVSATAIQGSGMPGVAYATGTVSGVSDTVYVYIDLSSSTLIAASGISIDGTIGTLELWGVNPDNLSPGIYSETVPIEVCADISCDRHLAGSPATLTFSYEVLPDPALTDSDGDGVNDLFDAFPDDDSETTDYDQDNIGDNADTDDDNDGVLDEQDDFPFNNLVSSDTTTINFVINGAGTFYVYSLPVDCKNQCSTVFNNSSSRYRAYIEFTPGEHYSIGSWTNCDTIVENGCLVDTGQQTELTVYLDLIEDPYALISVDSPLGGVVESLGPLGCSGNCEIKVYTDSSASLTLKPVPSPGHEFSGWGGTCEGMEDCEVTVFLGATISVSADFVDTGLTTDLCSGSAVTSGSGTDSSGVIGAFLPLCHGQVLLANIEENTIVWRDVVNSVTLDEYQLSAAPIYLALDEENKLLFVTHGVASKISRVDLATGEVVEIFLEGGADSLAVSQNNDLVISGNGTYPSLLLDSRYGTSLSDSEIDFVFGSNISYNDATNRLITSDKNYFFDTETKTFSEQGPSNAGGRGARCDVVVVSPDGEHGALACGGGNGDGYTVFDFSSHDPSIIFGEWDTGAYPTGAAFSPSSKFAWLSNGSALQLFSVSTHALLMSYAPHSCNSSGHVGDTRHLAVSNDGSVLLALNLCSSNGDPAFMRWIYYPTN